MKPYRDIDDLLNSEPFDSRTTEQGVKHMSKWIANVLRNVDLEDEEVAEKILAHIKRAKAEHSGWLSGRTFGDNCPRHVKWIYKYMIKHRRRLEVDVLQVKKNYQEILALLAVLVSINSMGQTLDEVKRKYPNAFKKRIKTKNPAA